MNHDTSVLFGLPGVRVQRVDLDEYGGRVVHVETAVGTSVPGCPACGVVSTSVKGLVTTAPRDLPYGEAELAVRWHHTPFYDLGRELKASDTSRRDSSRADLVVA